MSEKKSITIDSSSLMGGGDTLKKKSTRRKSVGSGEHRIRPSSIVQPSTLKKTLLERIKQHQRTRERSRDTSTASDAVVSGDAGSQSTAASVEPAGDNFSQSIDFLRKLAMKRRQQTQKRHSSSASSSSASSSLPEAKTPEAQMLNKVAETLHHGEILTNTGLLGLPVVPTLVQPTVSPELLMNTTTTPLLNLIPNTVSGITETPQLLPPTPKLTELADMYNNTVAAAPLTDAITDATAAEANTSASEKSSSAAAAAASTYVPTKIEDFMPSIFIKEEPPHGCLKNGKKPTFREWASKLFGGGGDNGDSGSTNQDPVSVTSVNGGGSKSAAVEDVRDITGMRVKIRKTHKKRFRIGKHDNVVGVLLKNKQTQRHIQSQHLTLKQKSIGEIRKHLYDHHLLKIGSNAPPDVLRRMYEDSILTGDVKNTNDGVLLHNFMSGGGE
ncbi:MAG: hypothetical protein EBU66_18465 [Bacteroidetes bacterium]|nr:hypothetical protein [Bacteroidota bacterium]